MADDLRPGQVAKITTVPPLPASLTDAILDSTDEELATAATQLADDTRDWLERVGVLKSSASVLDLSHDPVMVISAIYGLVMPWWHQPGWQERPLGHMLKVVPADVAESVMRLLGIGGFLPPEPPRLEK